MKKLLLLAFCIVFVVSLPGCGNSFVREADMEYMVSSIGFDKLGQEIKMFAEIIVVNSGESETGAKTQIFSAAGKSPRDAMYKLHSKLSKPLMLNHCGLLVISEKIQVDEIKEIFNICLLDKSITGAIKLIATKNVESLMNLKPESDIALGYEISNALKQYSNFTGAQYKNRFYEIEAYREGKTMSYSLPYFSVENEKYYIDGSLIYKDDAIVLSLDNNDSIKFSIMSGNFKSGKISGENGFEIKLKSVSYDIDYKNKKLYVAVKLDIDGDSNAIQFLKSEIHKGKISKLDIYYIADRIYRKHPELWEKIEKDYKDIFKNAKVNFEVI